MQLLILLLSSLSVQAFASSYLEMGPNTEIGTTSDARAFPMGPLFICLIRPEDCGWPTTESRSKAKTILVRSAGIPVLEESSPSEPAIDLEESKVEKGPALDRPPWGVTIPAFPEHRLNDRLAGVTIFFGSFLVSAIIEMIEIICSQATISGRSTPMSIETSDMAKLEQLVLKALYEELGMLDPEEAKLLETSDPTQVRVFGKLFQKLWTVLEKTLPKAIDFFTQAAIDASGQALGKKVFKRGQRAQSVPGWWKPMEDNYVPSTTFPWERQAKLKYLTLLR